MTRDEALAILSKYIIGTDDESLLDLEALTDFINNSAVDRSAEVEAEWRKRYRDRFFGVIPENESEIFEEKKIEENTEESREETLTLDELMKPKEEE